MANKGGAGSMIVKLLVAAGMGGLAAIGVPKLLDNQKPAQSTTLVADNQSSRIVPSTKTDAIMSYSPVVKKASGAVVNVYAQSIQKGRVALDPFWGLLKIPDKAQQSQGSGVIVRDNGVIVTNNHVVEGAQQLVVVLGDRREFPAKVIVTDPRTDLAVLKIDTAGEKLPTLNFANTQSAQVGDQVLAIGNPFGVGQTVTAGIISALARTDVGITDYSFFIQTDASINPGNSGGALVDMNGNLVGINTAIFSQSGSSAGVGFAIPAEMVKRVVDGAVSTGKIVRAWTGIGGQTVTNDMAKTLNLPKPSGVLITDIYPDTAAAKAGLKRGDVVVSLSGTAVTDASSLRYLAATKAPGEDIVFEYYRGGNKQTVTGKLTAPAGSRGDEKPITGKNSFDGIKIVTLSPAVADDLGIDMFQKGVVITNVDGNSIAARSGFQIGDVVLEINSQPVTNVKDFEGKLGSGRQGQVTILRNGQAITAVLFL